MKSKSLADIRNRYTAKVDSLNWQSMSFQKKAIDQFNKEISEYTEALKQELKQSLEAEMRLDITNELQEFSEEYAIVLEDNGKDYMNKWFNRNIDRIEELLKSQVQKAINQVFGDKGDNRE